MFVTADRKWLSGAAIAVGLLLVSCGAARGAGIIVNPTMGLVTTESGGQHTFTVVLESQPTADVTIGLSSSDEGEGLVSPTSVTFTSGDWSVAQAVTVTGVDDGVVDGIMTYTILTAAATSADTDYEGLDAADVSVTNMDDDTVGITVNPTSDLVTTEFGGWATFTVVLSSQPTADVTIDLSSSDTTEGTVNEDSLTFTPADWNTPQVVTVTGVDDALADGDVAYTIITAPAVSADGKYNGMSAPDVSVTNTDDDGAGTVGIIVSPTSGLVTTEAGGQATFTVVLDSKPSPGVTIDLWSSDATEGTVSPVSLTFTPTNWDVPQIVTVTGVNDAIDDGDVGYTILAAEADVSVTNTDDDDTAGITVSGVSGDTTEAGGTATFTVVLTSEPTTDVTVCVGSSDTGEGTASPAMLTFTSANWNAPQTVTVSGVDDDVEDGDVTYRIVVTAAVSDDPMYNGLDPADVSVTNTDDDAAGDPGDTAEPGCVPGAGGAGAALGWLLPLGLALAAILRSRMLRRGSYRGRSFAGFRRK